MMLHVYPAPVKPDLQVQEYDSTVSEHFESSEHKCVPSLHSFWGLDGSGNVMSSQSMLGKFTHDPEITLSHPRFSPTFIQFNLWSQ